MNNKSQELVNPVEKSSVNMEGMTDNYENTNEVTQSLVKRKIKLP